MLACPESRPAPLRCPTADEVLSSALALLPRGRAWQSNEGGPVAGLDRDFAPGEYSDAFAIRYRRGSVLRRFWTAVAEVYAHLNRRLCDLRLEFWCATHSETHDLWMAEYGLPDDCDPFPDLCAKVAAIGGTRCEYYAEIAARAGWSIACIDKNKTCGVRAGSRRAKAGFAQPGAVRMQPYLTILVDLPASPAYVAGPRAKRVQAGAFKAGRRLICHVPAVINISALECLMARIVHAEVVIEYGVING
jgi:hypothetical protein